MSIDDNNNYQIWERERERERKENHIRLNSNNYQTHA